MSHVPLTDLAGIDPMAMLNLNKLGIVSVEDLLKADTDDIIRAVESFDVAQLLFEQARRFADSDSTDPSASEPTSHSLPAACYDGPAWDPRPFAAAVIHGMHAALAARADVDPRPSMVRRMSLASTVLTRGGTLAEAAAAMLLLATSDRAENDPAQLRERFGPEVASVLDALAALRAIPISPDGLPDRAYVARLEAASPELRTLLAGEAAETLSRLADRGEDPVGSHVTLAYHRTLAQALHDAGDDALAKQVEAYIERAEEVLSRRCAA